MVAVELSDDILVCNGTFLPKHNVWRPASTQVPGVSAKSLPVVYGPAQAQYLYHVSTQVQVSWAKYLQDVYGPTKAQCLCTVCTQVKVVWAKALQAVYDSTKCTTYTVLRQSGGRGEALKCSCIHACIYVLHMCWQIPLPMPFFIF